MTGGYFPYPRAGMLAATRHDGSAYHRSRALATSHVGPYHVMPSAMTTRQAVGDGRDVQPVRVSAASRARTLTTAARRSR